MHCQKKNRTRRSGGKVKITSTIVKQGSTEVVHFKIPPGERIIANQETLAYMDGSLKATVGLSGGESVSGGGLFSAFSRAFAGQSFLINSIVNNGTAPANLTLAPALPGGIQEITINKGETWRIYPGSFLAGTSNISISGSLFNFSSLLVNDTSAYTSIKTKDDHPGKIWVYGFGGIEQHKIVPSEQPFILNSGTFLAMPAEQSGVNFWKKYVSVGLPGSMLSSYLTRIGFVMKIQDKSGAAKTSIPVYTQTLNIGNFKQYIEEIAEKVVKEKMNND